MVRRKFIKVTRATLICSVIAASLSVMGVGYASWNKSVSIIGKISTGSIDVIFNEAYFNNNPNGDKNFDEIHFGNNLNGDIKDTADTQDKKYNDISVEFDSNTILIRGVMYYPNDIVLKYNVVDEGTIPVEMINEGEKKIELENGGFIIINPRSETIKVHIPRADGFYTTIAPIEFKSKYGSWKETLFIDLNIFVELPNNEVTTSSAISMEVTTSSTISMDISDNSIFNDSIEALAGEIEVIISEDEIVESLDSDSSQLKEETDKEIENNAALEEQNKSESDDQSQDNSPELEKENEIEIVEKNDSNPEQGEDAEGNYQQTEEELTEIGGILETADELVDAIIVESESNNEVEAYSSQIEEEAANEIEDITSEIEEENQSEANNTTEDNEIDIEEQSKVYNQSQDNDPKVEENDSNTESGEEAEVNVQQSVEVTQTETEKILEVLDKLSNAIIVESKTNNEVDNQ